MPGGWLVPAEVRDKLNKATPAAVSLYMTLLGEVDETWECKVSLSALSTLCGMSQPTVSKGRDELVESELIRWESGTTRHVMTRVRLKPWNTINPPRIFTPKDSLVVGDPDNTQVTGDTYKESLMVADGKVTPCIDIGSISLRDRDFIFLFWRQVGFIKHRALNKKMHRALARAAKEYSPQEIVVAIRNYRTICDDPRYFWTHTEWTLDEFLMRGLYRFADRANPLREMLAQGERKKETPNGSGKYADLERQALQ